MKREPIKSMGSCIKLFIAEENLEDGLLRLKVFEAWESVLYAMTSKFLTKEQASTLTANKFYKDKVFSCRLNSSVVRNQLSMAKPQIVRSMNTILKGNYVCRIIFN